MNSNNLSKRLKMVAGEVKKGARIADIGSDHAYLPIHLVKEGIINFAIAGEVAKGPLSNSEFEIQDQNVQDSVIPRLGDGLDVIKDQDQIDTIVIAGMGGILIQSILDRNQGKLKNVKRLVLQPNVGELELRTWLQNNNFKIVREKIVAEDRHIYEMIAAEPGHSSYSDAELHFGPYLSAERNTAYLSKWERELKRLLKVENAMKNSNSHDSNRLKQFQEEISRVQEMLSK
ncbi:class I SAM-dependent methyltransferase [Pediococcus argentinicus]|uniref:tRNA (adenine(22)-N(1))-methyltransferase n=1 Tax=Pediococcus argentinicus TaxID=480391 RepID=UPI00338E1489